MPKSKFIELMLTCDSWQEAQRVADRLLHNKLIARVEFLEIKAEPWYQRQFGANKEIKLILHSAEHLLDEIEAEIKQLLGREDFALQALPASNISEDVQAQLQEVIKSKD